LAAAFLLATTGPLLCGPARLWVHANLIILAGLFGYGFLLQHYSAPETIRDLAGYLLPISFVVIGAHRDFWRLNSSWILWIFTIGLVVNVFAILDFRDLLAENGDSTRVARQSLSYRTSNILDYWPALLLLGSYMKSWQRWIISFGVVFVLGQQLLFQKRLEVVFDGAILLTYWITLESKGFLGRNVFRLEKRRMMPRIGLLAAIGAVAFIALARPVIEGQTKSFLERFQGNASGEEGYNHGFWSVFTTDNERIQIVLECFTDFNVEEWIVGRGMGGAFPYSGFKLDLLQTSSAEELYDSLYLPDTGYLGKRYFEIGILAPILKGGALLFFGFYSIYFILWSRRRILYKDRFAIMCLLLSFLWFGYTLMGGNFALPMTFQMFCMYAPLGWCLSRHGPVCPIRASSDRDDVRPLTRHPQRIASGEARPTSFL